MQRVRPQLLVIVALAILALLGHVCTPLTDPVVALVGHHDGHHEHHAPDGEGHSGDALHSASCEALRPAVAQAPMVTPHATAVPAIVAAPRIADACRRPIAVVSHAPPIYLLHAALLI